MKLILIGQNGFVGGNLNIQYKFDGAYSKHNVFEAYGQNPDILIYCGVPGNKTMANNNEEEDNKAIQDAKENIIKINPKKLVLISTVDVYENPTNKTEDDRPDATFPYGKHRLELENWVISNIKDYHIVRLPAIYGKGLKKNLIYDLIHTVPPFLSQERYNEFSLKNDLVKEKYMKNEYGFHQIKQTNPAEYELIKQFFIKEKFQTINFTDSRAQFQFFNLAELRNIIDFVIKKNIKVFNIVTEPISSKELVESLTNQPFENLINENFQNYNLKTKYSNYFGRNDGYIESKDSQLSKIFSYIQKEKKNERI